MKKDQAWNKLQDRLQQRKKKRAGWYWLAAACIVAVVSSMLIRIGVHEELPAVASSVAANPNNSPAEMPDSKPVPAPVHMNQPLVVSPAHQGNMKLSNLPVAPCTSAFQQACRNSAGAANSSASRCATTNTIGACND